MTYHCLAKAGKQTSRSALDSFQCERAFFILNSHNVRACERRRHHQNECREGKRTILLTRAEDAFEKALLDRHPHLLASVREHAQNESGLHCRLTPDDSSLSAQQRHTTYRSHLQNADVR
jgi:hypothetical protein